LPLSFLLLVSASLGFHHRSALDTNPKSRSVGRKSVGADSQEDSCPDYMLKAEECLKAEEERVDGYLHIDSKPKLLEQVEREVLGNYETQLLEKENSGCAALLRDDKVGGRHENGS